MAMQFISPSPLPTGNGSLNPARIDGDFYDDELPPELFDREEDMEDLNAFMHVAGLPDETF